MKELAWTSLKREQQLVLMTWKIHWWVCLLFIIIKDDNEHWSFIEVNKKNQSVHQCARECRLPWREQLAVLMTYTLIGLFNNNNNNNNSNNNNNNSRRQRTMKFDWTQKKRDKHRWEQFWHKTFSRFRHVKGYRPDITDWA